MFDQDFINDGYANSKPLKVAMTCPKCGRNISRTWSHPMAETRCQAKVPCTRPREKGQPRLVYCNEIMEITHARNH